MVYRRFVHKFAVIEAPLSRKLKMGEPRSFHILMQDDHNALATLEHKLVSAIVLISPRSKEQLSLDRDASNKRKGCVLMSVQPERPENHSSIGEGR